MSQNVTLLDKSKKITATNFEEYLHDISNEKMDLLATFMKKEDRDAFLLLAKNKTFLSKQLKPSCDKIDTLINNPIAVSNKLGTNFKLKQLSDLSNILRKKPGKSVLYFDIETALLCDNSVSKPICEYHNVFGDFFYPYEKRKFSLTKQLYNLDVWLLLFQNIFFHDKLTNKSLGSLQDLYQVVLILPPRVYDNLVAKTQEDHINVITKNEFIYVRAQELLTPSILSFYLYAKFYHDGDLLLSTQNYEFLQHGEGISVNGVFKYIEEFLPFIVSDMEMLKETLGQFYPDYNFLTKKIDLNVIKKKKYSKKRPILKRKAKKGNSKKSNQNKYNKKKYNKKK